VNALFPRPVQVVPHFAVESFPTQFIPQLYMSTFPKRNGRQSSPPDEATFRRSRLSSPTVYRSGFDPMSPRLEIPAGVLSAATREHGRYSTFDIVFLRRCRAYTECCHLIARLRFIANVVFMCIFLSFSFAFFFGLAMPLLYTCHELNSSHRILSAPRYVRKYPPLRIMGM
jgi:hypothetical protein